MILVTYKYRCDCCTAEICQESHHYDPAAKGMLMPDTVHNVLGYQMCYACKEPVLAALKDSFAAHEAERLG